MCLYRKRKRLRVLISGDLALEVAESVVWWGLFVLLEFGRWRFDRGMQQGDQTVLSLRPGGGRGGGGGSSSRLPGPRSDSSSSSISTSSSAALASFAFGSFSSDLPLLRPHGGAAGSFALTVLCFVS